MRKTIFVDMDGVLCDFDKRYTEMFGTTPSEVRRTRDREMYRSNWWKFITDRGFEQLDWFKGAQQLVAFLEKQDAQKCILSSSSNLESHNVVMPQKIRWLCEHGINWPTVIVPGRSFKAGFASSNAALIDDTPDIIEAFTNNGGLGILHKADAKWHTTFTIETWMNNEAVR